VFPAFVFVHQNCDLGFQPNDFQQNPALQANYGRKQDIERNAHFGMAGAVVGKLLVPAGSNVAMLPLATFSLTDVSNAPFSPTSNEFATFGTATGPFVLVGKNTMTDDTKPILTSGVCVVVDCAICSPSTRSLMETALPDGVLIMLVQPVPRARLDARMIRAASGVFGPGVLASCCQCEASKPAKVKHRPSTSGELMMLAVLVKPCAKRSAPTILRADRMSEFIWSVFIFCVLWFVVCGFYPTKTVIVYVLPLANPNPFEDAILKLADDTLCGIETFPPFTPPISVFITGFGVKGKALANVTRIAAVFAATDDPGVYTMVILCGVVLPMVTVPVVSPDPVALATVAPAK